MSPSRKPTRGRPITREELDQAVSSLKTAGGLYEYIAACVEHDNHDALAAEEGTDQCSPK